MAWSDGVVAAARKALDAGAPISVRREHGRGGGDAEAVAVRERGGLHSSRTRACRALAEELGTTRSAAALELRGERLGGAVVAVGNAPTALFRLLEMVAEGAPRPAAVIGIPVGFIGAAESSDALAASDLEFLVVRGRRGGSAMTAAAAQRHRQ